VATPQGAFYRGLGQRLRAARNAARMSQERLAQSVGLSRPSIVNIEKGRQPVYVHSLVEMARILGTTLDAIVPPVAPDGAATPKVKDPMARQWFATFNAKPGDSE